MISLKIHHRTSYHYHQPVRFGPHRLMLRPRESRDLRLISMEVSVSPAAELTWAHDVFGNAVASAQFQDMDDTLVVDSVVALELHTADQPIFTVAESALSYPFRYSNDEWIDLGALAVPQYPDYNERLRAWAEGFIRDRPTPTLALLHDLSLGVRNWVSYQRREQGEAQAPLQTLDWGWGSCRDFAVLFMEAARSLGFGARIVSGYLYNPDQCLDVGPDSGSTHAWVEVFVPGAGWTPFDPTNRGGGGPRLIPVAVALNIRQVKPVSGSFSGMTDAFRRMVVSVSVTADC